MGKLKCFEIVFDSNRNVYHPGERVTGQCVVELKGDMKMRALRFAETLNLGAFPKFLSNQLTVSQIFNSPSKIVSKETLMIHFSSSIPLSFWMVTEKPF